MRPRIAIALLLALASCSKAHSSVNDAGPNDAGSNDAGPIDAGPPPLTLREFVDQLGEASAKLATCELGIAPGAASYLYGESETSSLATARLEEDLDAGRVAFDPALAASCLAAMAPPGNCWGETASVQGLFLQQPADCAAALAGTVAPGATCYDDSSCADGYCNVATCPGTCVAALGQDAGCSAAQPCGGALVCNVTVCEPPGIAGTDCKKNNDCLPGLVCLTTVTHANGLPLTPDGTCTVPLDAGSSCNPLYSNSCTAGFWCQPTEADAGTPGTCVAQVSAGGDCTVGHGPTGFTEPIESMQCKGHQICSELVVDTNGFVTTPGHCDKPGDVGAPCLATGVAATQGCMLGLLCDSTGRCVMPPAVDAGCATPPSDNSGLLLDYCLPGAYCTAPGNHGICRPKLDDATGGCLSGPSCLSGACSVSKICSPATVASGCSISSAGTTADAGSPSDAGP